MTTSSSGAYYLEKNGFDINKQVKFKRKIKKNYIGVVYQCKILLTYHKIILSVNQLRLFY